jgi:PHD/YefM family antitoxin component YafN of YafNO toxin-antitoxin module
MMRTIQTESVSGFRSSYDAVLKKLVNGPVLLLQRSSLAAVVVAGEEWNELQARLVAQQQEISALKMQLRNALLDKHSLEMQHVPGQAMSWEQVQQAVSPLEPVHG